MLDHKTDTTKLEINTNDRLRAFRRIDLNLFVVFTTIYDYRSLTIASRHLGLTQPAVSHSLSRLREALGDRLFVRKGGESVPTPFANSIIDDVRQALELIRSGPLGEQVFDPTSSKANFRLSMDPAMEAFLLPSIVKRLSIEAPWVTVTSSRIQRRSVEAELARGDLNAAIDVDYPFGREISRQSLGSDRTIVVARKDNPLIKNGLSREDYLEANHIIVTTRKDGVAIEDYELARLGHRRHIAVRCSTLMVGLKIAASTDYLLSLGRVQLNALMPDENLAVFDFPFTVPGVEAKLFWHESVDNEPSNIWIRNLIVECLDVELDTYGK